MLLAALSVYWSPEGEWIRSLLGGRCDYFIRESIPWYCKSICGHGFQLDGRVKKVQGPQSRYQTSDKKRHQKETGQ